MRAYPQITLFQRSIFITFRDVCETQAHVIIGIKSSSQMDALDKKGFSMRLHNREKLEISMELVALLFKLRIKPLKLLQGVNE